MPRHDDAKNPRYTSRVNALSGTDHAVCRDFDPARDSDTDRAYNHIAKVGSFITIGGTAGFDPATGQLAGADVAAQTLRILESFRTMLISAGSDLDHVLVPGNAITSEVVFFHRGSATAIFTDLIQQFPANWFSGWRTFVAKWDLMLGAEPSVPRKFRVAFTNRRVARASLERILAWPAEKVLMAHGTPVTQDEQAFMRRAFKWLIASTG